MVVRVVRGPLAPSRLVDALNGWLSDHRFPGDAWTDGQKVFLTAAPTVERLFRADPWCNSEPLADLADLARCHGYRVTNGRHGGLAFLGGLDQNYA